LTSLSEKVESILGTTGIFRGGNVFIQGPNSKLHSNFPTYGQAQGGNNLRLNTGIISRSLYPTLILEMETGLGFSNNKPCSLNVISRDPDPAGQNFLKP